MSKSRREVGGEVIVISAWPLTRRQAVRGWGDGGRSRKGGRGRRRRTVENEVFIVANPNRCEYMQRGHTDQNKIKQNK